MLDKNVLGGGSLKVSKIEIGGFWNIMKKFMILLLSLAVLFSFAACDNSSNTPADDTTTSTPVSEAAQMREAANEIVNLLYASGTSEPTIDVKAIIGEATKFNSTFADGTLKITKEYPEGGDVVGTVTVVLSGQYTKPTSSTAADGKLNVDDYTVSAEDLQIIEDGDYKTESFSITAPVKGISLSDIKADGSAWKMTGADSAVIYAPLPDQAASATITAPVTVAMTNDIVHQEIKETKTFASGLVTVLATLVANDNNDAPSPDGFVLSVATTDYLTKVKGAFETAISSPSGDLYKVLFTDDTVEGLTATINNNAGNKTETAEESTVVLIVNATNYKFDTDKTITGTLTFTFDGERTLGKPTVNLSNLVITGSCTLAGGDYVIDVVTDEDYPITADITKFTAKALTVDANDSTKVSAISLDGFDSADLKGRASIEGITFALN